jgi:hypothetical protein
MFHGALNLCDGYLFEMFKAVDRKELTEVRKKFPPPP